MNEIKAEKKGCPVEAEDSKEAKPRTAEIQTSHRKNKEEFPDTDAVPPPNNVCGFPC